MAGSKTALVSTGPTSYDDSQAAIQPILSGKSQLKCAVLFLPYPNPTVQTRILHPPDLKTPQQLGFNNCVQSKHPPVFKMAKEKNYNPVQAQRKADKAKAIKKSASC